MNGAPEEFEKLRLCFRGTERVVYRFGAGPAVVLLQEIPNQTPQYFELAKKIAAAGFELWCPNLFGKAGANFSKRSSAKALLRFCISREFRVFSENGRSPIMDWVSDLCEYAGKGGNVGLIGMCFTGNFALTMLAEPWMRAPVLVQPSLPYGISPALRRALYVDSETLKSAPIDRKVLALRFTNDPVCPASRFKALKEQLGSRLQTIEIDSSLGNPHRIPPFAHSVLTIHAVFDGQHPTHKALNQVLEFLRDSLISPAQ